MADMAVVGILLASMGFVMWVGHLLTRMVGGSGDGAGEKQ
jgi:hypothetical protein